MLPCLLWMSLSYLGSISWRLLVFPQVVFLPSFFLLSSLYHIISFPFVLVSCLSTYSHASVQSVRTVTTHWPTHCREWNAHISLRYIPTLITSWMMTDDGGDDGDNSRLFVKSHRNMNLLCMRLHMTLPFVTMEDYFNGGLLLSQKTCRGVLYSPWQITLPA